MYVNEAGEYVSRCHSLASLLEVSAYPKPGNIHRLRDSEDTYYEHFLAGSVATAPIIRDLASRSYVIKNGNYKDLLLGDSILRATKEMMKWQFGGNVQLGIILLHVPLAAAAGAIYQEEGINPKLLQKKLKEIINKAQPIDSVKIFETIKSAMKKKVLGRVNEFDVTDQSSISKILKEKIKPINIFRLCSNHDSICNEWVSNFEITFSESYPYLSNLISKGEKINEATVKTYLNILSKHPDSLIIRKSGKKEAQKVSKLAEKIIKIKDNKEYMTQLWDLDTKLWEKEGKLNPGTTADLVSASIFVFLLTGWRP